MEAPTPEEISPSEKNEEGDLRDQRKLFLSLRRNFLHLSLRLAPSVPFGGGVSPFWGNIFTRFFLFLRLQESFGEFTWREKKMLDDVLKRVFFGVKGGALTALHNGLGSLSLPSKHYL
ncbi:hypothetical protein CDAR_418851 [Caerostris darwini]|uniref:Uncharacterized protein n=1 Tax=Caerostris darwini TaxID=1538125 RepID=A0AAV4MWL8_9ARAC|nr:hypothetical protein CDAR_418851 [Caerostris darwini]